jgi:hypothetical protein
MRYTIYACIEYIPAFVSGDYTYLQIAVYKIGQIIAILQII